MPGQRFCRGCREEIKVSRLPLGERWEALLIWGQSAGPGAFPAAPLHGCGGAWSERARGIYGLVRQRLAPGSAGPVRMAG